MTKQSQPELDEWLGAPGSVYLPLEVAIAMSADAPPDTGDILYVRASTSNDKRIGEIEERQQQRKKPAHHAIRRDIIDDVDYLLSLLRQPVISGRCGEYGHRATIGGVCQVGADGPLEPHRGQ